MNHNAHKKMAIGHIHTMLLLKKIMMCFPLPVVGVPLIMGLTIGSGQGPSGFMAVSGAMKPTLCSNRFCGHIVAPG